MCGIHNDIIIWGIENNQLSEGLLKETNLTLNKCIDICKAVFSTETKIKEIRSKTITVNK